jgi:hypothetical protein
MFFLPICVFLPERKIVFFILGWTLNIEKTWNGLMILALGVQIPMWDVGAGLSDETV